MFQIFVASNEYERMFLDSTHCCNSCLTTSSLELFFFFYLKILKKATCKKIS